MPYFRFDDDSLEPREVIPLHTTPHVALKKTPYDVHLTNPYVNLLTTKRRSRCKSNPRPAPRSRPSPAPASTSSLPRDSSPAPISYPATVIPGRSDKRKEKRGYCMRFSRRLDRFHECPDVYDEAICKPLPTLLSLPAEIRQHILDLVLDDNELFFPRPNSGTRDLALSCKTFETDLREVSKMWKKREDILRAEPVPQLRKDLDALMTELYAPIRSASLVNRVASRVRAASLFNRISGTISATAAKPRRRRWHGKHEKMRR